MAALALPLIEGIGTRILVWLGVGIAGAGAAAEVAHRKEDAENARTAPIAGSDAQTKEKEACKECPPDKGVLVTRNWNMSPISRAYQARITGFTPYTEWKFGGVDFDGFRSSECLLQEAKAKYDQFFDPEDGQPKFFFRLSGERKIRNQARAQSAVVVASSPSRLNWYFMQPLSYRYFTGAFSGEGLPIRAQLQP